MGFNLSLWSTWVQSPATRNSNHANDGGSPGCTPCKGPATCHFKELAVEHIDLMFKVSTRQLPTSQDIGEFDPGSCRESRGLQQSRRTAAPSCVRWSGRQCKAQAQAQGGNWNNPCCHMLSQHGKRLWAPPALRRAAARELGAPAPRAGRYTAMTGRLIHKKRVTEVAISVGAIW